MALLDSATPRAISCRWSTACWYALMSSSSCRNKVERRFSNCTIGVDTSDSSRVNAPSSAGCQPLRNGNHPQLHVRTASAVDEVAELGGHDPGVADDLVQHSLTKESPHGHRVGPGEHFAAPQPQCDPRGHLARRHPARAHDRPNVARIRQQTRHQQGRHRRDASRGLLEVDQSWSAAVPRSPSGRSRRSGGLSAPPARATSPGVRCGSCARRCPAHVPSESLPPAHSPGSRPHGTRPMFTRCAPGNSVAAITMLLRRSLLPKRGEATSGYGNNLATAEVATRIHQNEQGPSNETS